MSEIDEIKSKGQLGIGLFIFIYVLVVLISSFKFHGSTLIVNVVIHGVFVIILFICVYFLSEYPIKVLSLSLVICGLDSLRLILLRIFDVLGGGGIGKLISLIIGGGVRLFALWAIWSALVGVRSIMRNQAAQVVD